MFPLFATYNRLVKTAWPSAVFTFFRNAQQLAVVTHVMGSFSPKYKRTVFFRLCPTMSFFFSQSITSLLSLLVTLVWPLKFAHRVLSSFKCLWHFFSKYVPLIFHLSLSYTQIELLKDSDKKCYFKVLPRYKVRSVGDKVRIGDQIQLESVKTEGQFLHCSKATFDLHYVESTR